MNQGGDDGEDEWQIDSGEDGENSTLLYSPRFFNLARLCLGYTHTEAGFRTVAQIDDAIRDLEKLKCGANNDWIGLEE